MICTVGSECCSREKVMCTMHGREIYALHYTGLVRGRDRKDQWTILRSKGGWLMSSLEGGTRENEREAQGGRIERNVSIASLWWLVVWGGGVKRSAERVWDVLLGRERASKVVCTMKGIGSGTERRRGGQQKCKEGEGASRVTHWNSWFAFSLLSCYA